MSPSRLSTAFVAALSLVLRAAPARAQGQGQEEAAPPPEPRYSVRAVGAAGLSSGTLGTPTVGGSLEWDVWGRTLPIGFGLRAGGLASGWGDEARHGTVYGGAVVSRFWSIGSSKVIISATLGFAVIHGAYSTINPAGGSVDEASGPILILRAAYLVPVGPVRLGIGLDALTIPGEGGSLLAAPMLDVPF